MSYIKITLQSDLCAGSGESFGNRVDTDVCLNAYGLPTIPARRIKGCLREVATMLYAVQPKQMPAETIARLFGTPSEKQGVLHLQDATLAHADALIRGIASIADGDVLKPLASPANVSALFTNIRAQTAIEETTGTAKEGSLRFTRVVNRQNPCNPAHAQVFYAPVSLPTQDHKTLAMLCKALRHLGTHQTRGLGAVQCTFVDAPMPSALPTPQLPTLPTDGTVQLTYHMTLTAPMTIAEGEQLGTSIPASAVIGCLAQHYLTTATVDAQFHALFHSSAVQFSAVTPLIQGEISAPTPLHLVLLKHEGRYANRYTPSFIAHDKSKKQKTLQGSYTAHTAKGYAIANPRTEVNLHHALARNGQDSTLYTQEALCKDQQYGGTITAPAALAPVLMQLLSTAPLRFGRSRTAQYGTCQLTRLCATSATAETIAPKGQFYVVLGADMLLSRDGIFTVQHSDVRAAICEALHLDEVQDNTALDWCIYRRIGGFQASWGLRKPEREVLCAGSVLVFEGDSNALPRTLTLGEYQQEGFGKCTLYTAAEFEAETTIAKATVDTAVPMADSNVFARFAAALLLRQAHEQVLQRAHILATQPDFTKGATASLVGRLRLMLAESGGDCATFLRNLNAIPADKVQSNKKRKAFAQTFYTSLFEVNKFPTAMERDEDSKFGENTLAEQEHYAALLLQNHALYTALQETMGTEQAAARVFRLWHAKAELLLTLMNNQLRAQNTAQTITPETEVRHG